MRIQSEAVERHLRQVGIISFAILIGVGTFGGVVWYLVNVSGFTPGQLFPTYLALGANLVALVAILKAQFLHRFFPPPGSQAPEDAVLAWHKRNTIIAFALREFGAFIALLGVLLTGQQAGGFAMAGLAIISMVIGWPKRGDVEPWG